MTENRQFLHFIIITMIMTTTHDSAIRGEVLVVAQEVPCSMMWVAACLDGLENGGHISVTETERAAKSAISDSAKCNQR